MRLSFFWFVSVCFKLFSHLRLSHKASLYDSFCKRVIRAATISHYEVWHIIGICYSMQRWFVRVCHKQDHFHSPVNRCFHMCWKLSSSYWHKVLYKIFILPPFPFWTPFYGRENQRQPVQHFKIILKNWSTEKTKTKETTRPLPPAVVCGLPASAVPTLWAPGHQTVCWSRCPSCVVTPAPDTAGGSHLWNSQEW